MQLGADLRNMNECWSIPVYRAEGEADRFSQLATEYALAPEVTRQRLYIETIEDVLARTKKIFIDQGEGSNNLLYLPLDRIGQGIAPPPSLATPQPQQQSQPQPSGASGQVPLSQQGLELIDRLKRELAQGRDSINIRR